VHYEQQSLPASVLVDGGEPVLQRQTLVLLHVLDDPLNDTTLTRSVHNFFHCIFRCRVCWWESFF
jgi:hypothetical protein